MKREGSKSFRLPRAKFTIFAGVLYFTITAGFITYCFTPKTADASSQERLFIPSIGLVARVRDIERTGNQLIAPETAAGVYRPTNHKSVIIGHSSTVFENLKNLGTETVFTFDHKKYLVKKREILEKAFINMNEVVSETRKNTVVIMTCYGTPLKDQDYSHRLIITAEEI